MTLSPAACPFFDDIHTERVGDGFYHTYEFSIPADHPSATLAVPKGYVIFPDIDGITKCLTIRDVEEHISSAGVYKRVSCEDAAQDELLCAVMEPATNTDDTAAEMLTSALAGSRWSVGKVEDTATLTHVWDNYPTKWECVLKVAEMFGLEVATRVETRGGAIVGRYIDLIAHRGSFTGKTIAYEKDTTDVRRIQAGGEVYTAMIGVGKDGLTFASSIWSTASGDPVNKPQYATQVELPSALEAFGITLDDGSKAHRVGVFRDHEEAVAGALLTKTYAALVDRSTPADTYDASVAMLERMPAQRPGDQPRSWERIRIGDEITVRNTAGAVPYTMQARVIEMRRSYSDPTADAVVLGKPSPRLSDYLLRSQLMWRNLTG